MISILIPAYNEETRIERTLQGLIDYLPKLERPYEIIVVDDGSEDRTVDIVEENFDDCVRVIPSDQNDGKGAALKTGIQNARGDIIYWTDADLPYALEFLEESLPLLEQDEADAVIGGRDLPNSKTSITYPKVRMLTGKIFSLLVNLFLPLAIFDTQCGFKGFRAESLKKAVFFSQEDRYAVDIEILLILRLWKSRIRRISVNLVRHEGSKVKIGRDSVALFRSLLRIFYEFKKRRYPLTEPKGEIQSVKCPVCLSELFKRLTTVKSVRFCRCPDCTTIFQNPRPVESLLDGAYDETYFSSDSVCSGYPDYHETSDLQKSTSVWMWDRLTGFTKRQEKVLDVGSGSGYFLIEGVTRGFEACGIDLFPPIEDDQFEFIHGSFLDHEFSTEIFDVVVFNDSFEHFIDPYKVLKKCKDIMKPGSVLCINTPNPNSWLAKISGSRWISLKLEHFVIYSPAVLEKMLRDFSFEVVDQVPSMQAVDWNFLRPRLKRLSSILTRVLDLLPMSKLVGNKKAPTGGITVIAKLT